MSEGTFRFKRGRCPICKQQAQRILESVLVDNYLVRNRDGSYDYDEDAECDAAWESGEPVVKKGKYSLTCAQGHQWETGLKEDK